MLRNLNIKLKLSITGTEVIMYLRFSFNGKMYSNPPDQVKSEKLNFNQVKQHQSLIKIGIWVKRPVLRKGMNSCSMSIIHNLNLRLNHSTTPIFYMRNQKKRSWDKKGTHRLFRQGKTMPKTIRKNWKLINLIRNRLFKA